MKKENLRDLKKELEILEPEDLIKVALRLAKLKTENKELLAYLLFDAEDPLNYAEGLKEDVLSPFNGEFQTTYHFTKSIRKSLRLIAKYLRFTSNRQGETELLLFLVNAYHQNYKHQYRTAALSKIVFRCLEKAETNISKLHEDLQADYTETLNDLLTKSQNRLGAERPETKGFFKRFEF